jgi:predicted RNA-binding Zn-ribbon protein involved in translation (DUF1610 family)
MIARRHSHTCIGCGYSLEYAEITDRCPECGAPVVRSISSSGLAELPIPALRAWQLGIWLRACSFWALIGIVVDAANPTLAGSTIDKLLLPALTLLGLAGSCGGALLTMHRSPLDFNRRWCFWRKVTRVCVAIEGAAFLFAFSMFLANGRTTYWPWIPVGIMLCICGSVIPRVEMFIAFMGGARKAGSALAAIALGTIPTAMVGTLIVASSSPMIVAELGGLWLLMIATFLLLCVAHPVVRIFAFARLQDLLGEAAREAQKLNTR